MAISYEHVPHPRVAERHKAGPPRTADESVGLNGRIALVLTRVVGSMWCAYAFAVLALLALPSALRSGDPMVMVQWVSQTFIQLVMLSVIMVGQNIMGKAADTRAEMTYRDAEGIFAEARQIQVHLAVQDQTMNATLERVQALEASLRARLADPLPARAGVAAPGLPASLPAPGGSATPGSPAPASAPQGSAPQGSPNAGPAGEGSVA